MRLQLHLLLGLTFLTAIYSIGQTPNTTAKKENDVQKSADSLKKAVKDLTSIFKKKKSYPLTTDNQNKQSSGQTSQANTNNIMPPENNNSNNKISSKNSLKPGDALPDAKYIDADQIHPFNAGAAVIQRGASYALIDSKGNFIIPCTTTETLTAAPINGYDNYIGLSGIFQYSISGGEFGFINAAGKVLGKTAGNTSANYSDNKRLVLVTDMTNRDSYKYIYVDANGKANMPKHRLDLVQEDIGRFSSNEGKFGYEKLSGGVLTEAIFDDGELFTNGMAAVAKKNEFGEFKYGYINNQGKLVIPFSFSVKPGPFSSGYAKVEPKDKSEFEYAFINKQGNIVLKQTLSDISKYGKFDNFKSFGYAFSQKNYMLDSTLKIISQKDFFSSFGIKGDRVWFLDNVLLPVENEKNPKLFFTMILNNAVTGQGFINLTTRKVVDPVFFEFKGLGNHNMFDPVSHLLYARISTGKDNHNVPTYREGFINEDGFFVLLKGTTSKW